MGQWITKPKYVPSTEELIFNPSFLKISGQQLHVDSFPPEIRRALEKRAVKDVVDLISNYCQVSPVSWTLVRQMEYFPRFYYNQAVNYRNIYHFLFFLRLASSHVYLDRQLCDQFTQLTQRTDRWYYQRNYTETLPLFKLGWQINQHLAKYRPIGPLEQFFRTIWDFHVYHLKSPLFESIFLLGFDHSIRREKLAIPGDDSFRGIISIIYHQEPADYSQVNHAFLTQLTTFYYQNSHDPIPYSPEQFQTYLTQLVDFPV